MSSELRKWWPAIFAVVFFSIPLLLFYAYPSSFWAIGDYEPLGLANALNMAYRVGDLQMYPARGMMDHPGVPFYLMSWLALALAGYPAASAGPGFFDAVIAHVEDFHRASVWLAALVGAAGVYLFVRVARNIVPVSVVVAGLLIWLASTPATLTMFVSPSNESFALLINALFFAILVRLAYDRNVTWRVVMLSACVGAFAYLNKLAYMYVPVALAAAGIANLTFRGVSRVRGRQLSIVFFLTFVLAVVAVGFIVIGWGGFLNVLRFHRNVILGSGLYGSGDRIVVSGSAVWNALAAIPVDQVYALVIALVGGATLAAAGVVTGRKRPEQGPVAVISIGTGLASFLSAIVVIKHYEIHYTAGVSATLPASVAAAWLLAKSWGWNSWLHVAGAVVTVAAILLMGSLAGTALVHSLSARTKISQQVNADAREIRTHLVGIKGAVEFAYRAPFPEYGKGFVTTFASVPRLTNEYLHSQTGMISGLAPEPFTGEIGAYVIDKGYFPTVESIKAAPNLVLLGPKPVTFKDGDKLIELHTAFLLIPN